MKKYLLLFSLAVLILLVGCEKKENSEWKLNKKDNTYPFHEEEEKSYKEAIKNSKEKYLIPIAVLGEQIVAGKNTMLLCIDTKKDIYKIITIYEDLKKEVKLTNSKVFNPMKFVNQNNSINKEQLLGGWETKMPGKPIMLEEELEYIFEKAVENIEEISYYPIRLLATNNKEKKEIILSYGRLKNNLEKVGIFILTIEKEKRKIIGNSYLDLKEWN